MSCSASAAMCAAWAPSAEENAKQKKMLDLKEIDAASEIVLRATSIPGDAVANVREIMFRPVD